MGQATCSEGRDWGGVTRELDLRLIEFRLRLPGSPPYLEAEAALVNLACVALQRVAAEISWLARAGDTQALALGTCADLLERWRSGRLYRFTRTYLRRALLNHVRDGRRWRGETLPEPADPHPQGLEELIRRELLALLPPAVAAIRDTLEGEDKDLFAAWVADGGRRGWQSRYAAARGKTPKWVSVRLEALREHLRRHGVADPDEFAAGLHECEQDAPAEGEDETSEPGPAASLGYEEQARRLSEAWPAAGPLVRAYQAGLTREQAAAALFADEADPVAAIEAALQRLHAAFVGLAGEFREADRAERFYRQIVQGKVADVVKAAAAVWPAERAALAARLRELARAKSPFAELPDRLGLAPGEVVRVVLDLKRVV